MAEAPPLIARSPARARSRPRVRLDYAGFWEGFDKAENWFSALIRERFEIELSDQPEVVIYSDGPSQAWRLHTGTRVYFSVERHRPRWEDCDYALTCHEIDDPRHLRLPLYVVQTDPERLIKDEGWADRVLAEPRQFCALLISNATARRGGRRIAFASRLMDRTPVASGGRWRNNVGGPIAGGYAGKRAWLRNYRFHVAFENESLRGYTTEKITDAMLADCIPVYWGNPEIANEFNPRAFLNLADFPSEDALIDRMQSLAEEPAGLRALLREPWFPDNRPNAWFDRERVGDFFERVFTTRIRPVARRRPWLHPGRWTLVRRNRPPNG